MGVTAGERDINNGLAHFVGMTERLASAVLQGFPHGPKKLDLQQRSAQTKPFMGRTFNALGSKL
jgi:hypothetical protein